MRVPEPGLPKRSLPSADTVVAELVYLLRTLQRTAGSEQVSLTEAELQLEPALTLGFVACCAFLKRHAYVEVERARNSIRVLPRGNQLVNGGADALFVNTVRMHFDRQLSAPLATPPPASTARPASRVRAIDDTTSVGAVGVIGTTATLAAPVSMVAVTADRYARGEVLGQGSLGSVLKARDVTLERDVVIKELSHVFTLVTYLPRLVIAKRVTEAVLAQARLEHPHILRVLDLSVADDAPAVVLEHAVGGSLRARMTLTPLPIDIVLRIVLQSAAALAFAHARGVVHGNLKPENILFDATGNVRLADFGLSRATEPDAQGGNSAPPVYVGRGNASYMAPEHLKTGTMSSAADVYALGILLYELLSGTLPGRRSPMPSSIARVSQALGDGANSLDDLFDRMTRDALTERLASCTLVQTQLQQLLRAHNLIDVASHYVFERDWLANPFDAAVPTGSQPVQLASAEIEAIETTSFTSQGR